MNIRNFHLPPLLLCIALVRGQQSIATPVIDTSQNGLVYLLLVLLFSIAYGVPILLWMVRVFNSRLRQRKFISFVDYYIFTSYYFIIKNIIYMLMFHLYLYPCMSVKCEYSTYSKNNGAKECYI